MDYTQSFLSESLQDLPIGETNNFIWFITDIGIVALFKKNKKFEVYNSNVESEANIIALDVSKEEKEYFVIEDKRLFLFFS